MLLIPIMNMQIIFFFFEDKEYPDKLKNVGNFPIILFYKGNINLLKIYSISIVGTRKPSEKAIYDTYRITKLLMDNKVCIVSGLAKGIDVSTHKCCLDKNYDNVEVALENNLYSDSEEVVAKAVVIRRDDELDYVILNIATANIDEFAFNETQAYEKFSQKVYYSGVLNYYVKKNNQFHHFDNKKIISEKQFEKNSENIEKSSS